MPLGRLSGMLLKKLLADRRGASVVESAFTLPIMILLMLGLAQMTVMLFAQSTIDFALSEGARYALVSGGSTSADIEERVRQSLSSLDPRGIKTLTVNEDTSNAKYRKVTLAVRYEVRSFMPFLPAELITLENSKVVYV